MTLKAYNVLQEVEVIVGYKTYIKLITELIDEEQKTFTTGMTREQERAQKAIKFADQGNKVAVISSGDAGIYGMAGLVLELIEKKELKLEVEVVPGVTAGSAAAACLGAPLMNDYAVLSLSDLLTSRAVIEKRLHKIARADLVTVLYNPRSKRRKKLFKKAQNIMLEYKAEETPVGIVRKAKRGCSEIIKTTLVELPVQKVDMLTTVIIGSQNTSFKGRFMLTGRGYDL